MDNLNTLPSEFTPVGESEPGAINDLIDILPPPDKLVDSKVPAKRWEVTKVMPRHREIMRRVLEGATYVQIAQAMGLHVQSIMLICTSPLFRGELEKLEESADFSVVKRAEELSNEALDTLKGLMRNARSEAIRKTSADSILDRAGYVKIEKRIIGIVGGEEVIRELGRRRRSQVADAADEAKVVNE
ncbi:hypothetical protein LCGC14_2143700 [marine sediment metagenome]|uniref:Uncharacterized protein n=1 Tax=marine sediment metagenome TaxID=412755 RepID=A0A0F9GTV7_9ZZZZ